jgi:hypothetical protein
MVDVQVRVSETLKKVLLTTVSTAVSKEVSQMGKVSTESAKNSQVLC